MRPTTRVFSAAAVCAAAFLGCALYGYVAGPRAAAQSSSPGELRVKRILIVDDQGKVRAILGPFEWKPAAGESDPPKNAYGLVVHADDGKPGVQLAAADEAASLDLRGSGNRTSVGASKEGAGMGLWSPEKILRYGLGMQAAGNGGITVHDLQGHERLGIGMPPTAGVSIHIKDEKEQDIWSAP